MRIEITIRSRQNLEFAVGQLRAMKIDPDRPFVVTAEQQKKKRSLSQNALYWKWLGIMGNATGNDPDDLHEFLKREYAEPRHISVKGEDFAVYSTAKMSTDEMSAYMDRVHTFAAHQRITLPLPEERFAA